MSFGSLERPRSAQPISEINVTPLVDVMLVLVVIFVEAKSNEDIIGSNEF